MTPTDSLTLVLGASPNERRQSYQAVKKLRMYRYRVIAWGVRPGMIEDVEILTELPQIKEVHTVSLYLSPFKQKAYYDYILGLKPMRIIFNFKTYNDELKRLAIDAGIQVEEGCTKLMVVAEEY
jgi:uncharacterized protein